MSDINTNLLSLFIKIKFLVILILTLKITLLLPTIELSPESLYQILIFIDLTIVNYARIHTTGTISLQSTSQRSILLNPLKKIVIECMKRPLSQGIYSQAI